jgi:branched-chain amino acid transport system ATP-binding protein
MNRTTTPLLEVENISAAYGDIPCLKSVSLSVQKGEIVTLLGANGAGKTTTLKAISGLMKLCHGRIAYDGSDVQGSRVESIVARRLIHVPEGRRVFSDLSVQKNLQLGAYLIKSRAANKRMLEQVYEQFPKLKQRRNQLAGTLSGGEQQMLAFGRAMMAQPLLLLLDEPSLGLAPAITFEIMQSIVEFKRAGISILCVEQNAHLALAVSDRGYVMESGEITMSGSAEALKNDPGILARYLGGSEHDGTQN